MSAAAQEKLRVSLHIGATKTGSSALQKLLFANREALQKSGVLYPDVGIASNAHHVLLGAVHPGAWNLHKDAYDVDRSEYFEREVRSIRDQAEQSGCRHLVLSSEYFWGEFNPRVYRLVREAFTGCNLRIFCCLRDPAYWKESTYLQALKGGEERGFARWLAQSSRMRIRGFDFDKVLKGWAEGTNALSTTTVRYQFDAMDDFMAQVFFELTGVELGRMPMQKMSGTENPSPTIDGMRKLRALNRLQLPENERAAEFRKIMKSHSRPPNTRKLYFPKQHKEES